MVDRLYENMLELISKRQEQHCNSTLCNLNFVNKMITVSDKNDCNSTLCNLNIVTIEQYIVITYNCNSTLCNLNMYEALGDLYANGL